MADKARATVIHLPDDLVKKIAADLKINDKSRIPTKLVLHGIDQHAAHDLGVAKNPVHVVSVVA